MNNIFKYKKLTIFVIFIGFVFSILLSINNLNKYDKNLIDENGNSYHQMIKGDAYRYLSHGNEIKDQLENNLSFLKLVESITLNIFPLEFMLYIIIFLILICLKILTAKKSKLVFTYPI